MSQAIRRRLELEARLTEAVTEGRLEILFQPQVSLPDGALVGVEALCRWSDPELGEVPPEVFIPIAEETGLIRPLGSWLLRRACEEVGSWHPAESGLRLAVNVSPLQLTEDFTNLVGELLEHCQWSGARLELELSETALVHARPEVADVLDGLRARGVAVVMDDFGARYSSLYHLRHFSFRKLKLDLSVIDGLASSDEDALMVATLISLSHQLGLEVIAEGVETAKQRDRLIAYGCDLAQGYLFGPPLRAEAFRTRALPEGAAPTSHAPADLGTTPGLTCLTRDRAGRET